MKKRNRNIEIFSLSALDLFASGMGAFVLLCVMLLPYYHKGKDYERQIGDMGGSLARAESESSEAKELLAAKLAQLDRTTKPEAVTLSKEERDLAAARARAAALKDKEKDIAERIESAKKELAAKESRVSDNKTKVSFRFLGLKTARDNYLVLVDGSARVKEYATNLSSILREAVSVFGPDKKFAVAFYRLVNGNLVYERWPRSGFEQGSADTQARAVEFMRRQHEAMGGGSATYQALMTALQDSADSIILVTDGVVYPVHNSGRQPAQIVQEATAANRSGIEINTVAVGMFYRKIDFPSFLNSLSLRTKGDFKAIPP